MFILLWSCDHDSPDILPTCDGSSVLDVAASTAAIAAILRVSISDIISLTMVCYRAFEQVAILLYQAA
jgi:hypothetical protein